MYAQGMSAIIYDKFTEARSHLKDLLDAAETGRAAVINRRSGSSAIVDRDRLVDYLRLAVANRFRLEADEDRWLATVSGAPLAGEGDTAAEAVEDLVDVLSEYAEDWVERLRHAPNHQHEWALVQLVEHSEPDDLVLWILGEH